MLFKEQRNMTLKCICNAWKLMSNVSHTFAVITSNGIALTKALLFLHQEFSLFFLKSSETCSGSISMFRANLKMILGIYFADTIMYAKISGLRSVICFLILRLTSVMNVFLITFLVGRWSSMIVYGSYS